MNKNTKSEKVVTVSWMLSHGSTMKETFTAEEAKVRIASLEASEAVRMAVAPTYSGDSVMNDARLLLALKTAFPAAPERSLVSEQIQNALEGIQMCAERISGLISLTDSSLIAQNRCRKLESIRDYLSTLCEDLDR